MNKKDEEIKRLSKIVNMLEQRISCASLRISTLEKVLASHAKCIGEMRGEENELESSNN